MEYRKAPRQRKAQFDRLSILSVAILLFAGGLVARLFFLQVLRHGAYAALAEERATLAGQSAPTRGQIYFRDAASPADLLPVAVNRTLQLLYANPHQVKDPQATVDKLGQFVAFDHDKTLQKLSLKNLSYTPLVHEVPQETADTIEKENIPGIAFAPEIDRYYPFADSMSQVTGFVGYKGDVRAGQYGLEGYWDDELSGATGTATDTSNPVLTQGRNGSSLVLTIDQTVQHTTCKKLDEAVQKHGADGGSIIIVRPATGAIVALCNTPGFDANRYTDVNDISVFTDSAITGTYEPGSVMKTMTLSAGLDKGLITPDTTYTDTGSVQIGKYTIRNSENKKYGLQSMSQVLEQSINTGAMYVEGLLGPDTFRSYLEKFGFGDLSGIDLQGENKGDLSPLKKKSDIYPATASFGQGITVTPLQLVMAYAAVANGGKLMKPYVVDEVVKPNGFHQKTEPTTVRQVISASAARTMESMLVNVVRLGHGKRADVAGYYIGGKTGTAQIPYPDKPGYDPSKNNGTFVGIVPITDPQFAMVVRIIDPKDVQFAESSAAPLFGDIASFLVKYYRVTPDDTTAKPSS